ncbi:MAG TPA: Fe-S-containing protein [Terriglobia bacterium]|nr:Fe-S-containing protein [Terriglobia bacterium]
MFQALVITLREGVEAALVVGIVFGYLKKTGCASWDRIVYWGLAAAALASLGVGYALHRLQLSELGDAREGWLMLAGAVFVASMVVWMWRTGKRLKQEIEGRLQTLAAAPRRGAALGLFAFVFLMVFREGVETVLFLGAVSLRTSSALLEFMGGLVGLGLAVAFGIAFFKGSIRVNLRKFFSVTTIILLVVALQLAIAGVHELSEAQVLPSSPREMALVGPFVNNDLLFFVIVIALCLFLVIAQRIQSGAATAALDSLPAPERRKVAAAERRDRFWKLTASAVALAVIVLISAQFIYSRVAQAVSPPEPLAIENGEARIPVAELAGHKLHRFSVTVGGSQVRLIAILDSSDSVRVALDACAICGAQGYYQDGGNVVCRNCGAAISVPTIGMAGGCNPIHLDPPYRVDGQTVIIPEAALEAAGKVFH